MHALIAAGQHGVGGKSFYASMKGTAPPNVQAPAYNPTNSVEMADDTTNNTMDTDTAGDQTTYNTNYDEGEQNLDLMLNVMDEQDKLKQDVLALGNVFIEDVQDRMGQMDIQYLTGLKKFFTVHMDTVRNTEPAASATPKLASLLHTYFSQSSSSTTQIAGSYKTYARPANSHIKKTDEKELQRGVRWHPVVDPPNIHSLTVM